MRVVSHEASSYPCDVLRWASDALAMELVVGFEPTRAIADGLQDRSNQPLWDTSAYPRLSEVSPIKHVLTLIVLGYVSAATNGT